MCDRDVVVDVFFNVGLEISAFFADMSEKNQSYLERAVAQAAAVLHSVWALRRTAGLSGVGGGLADLKASHAAETAALGGLLAAEHELLAFLAKPFEAELELATLNLERLREQEEAGSHGLSFLTLVYLSLPLDISNALVVRPRTKMPNLLRT